LEGNLTLPGTEIGPIKIRVLFPSYPATLRIVKVVNFLISIIDTR